MRVFLLFLISILVVFPVMSQVKQGASGGENNSVLSVATQSEMASARIIGNGSDVIAYPSPFKSSFTIEPASSAEIKNVSVVNILGKKVLVVIDLVSNKAFVTFDSGVPDGIYLCKITLANEIKTIRMVKSAR